MATILHQRLTKVRSHFLTVLPERLGRLRSLHDQMRQQQDVKSAIEEISAISHKIAGTAGTLGFEALGQCAIETEEMMRAQIRKEIFPREELNEKIVTLCKLCEDSIEKGAS